MDQLLEITVSQALRERAAKSGNNEFIVFPTRNIRYTFDDIDKRADVLAGGLLAMGLKKGDHIGIWAHNIPEWAPIFYAIARAGLVIVPINVNCKHSEIGYILGHADIKCLFFVEKYRETELAEILYQVIPELKTAVQGNLRSAQFPFLKIVVSIGETNYTGMYTLDDIIALGDTAGNAGMRQVESAVVSTDILAVMYTSGTTGFPKGAMLTHRNMLNSIYQAFLRGVVPGEIETIFNPLPYFYITALSGCLLGGILFGHKIVCVEAFIPDISLDIIRNEQCSRIFGVPVIFLALMGHPKYKSMDLSCIKYASIGGTNCPPDLLKNIFTGMRLQSMHHLYGLTETSPFISAMVLTDPADPHIDTVGDPLPGVEVSIRDTANKECPLHTEGEVCVKGYGVMRGYYKMEKATHETIDADGWLHTGDLGYLVEGGYLVLSGRIKELIIANGVNIYPKEVENILLTMPAILDAQVAGIPSRQYGEAVGVFIIMKPGQTIGENEIIDFCKERISFQKVPRYVFFLEAYPLSGNGKVQKFKLAQQGVQILKEKGLDP